MNIIFKNQEHKEKYLSLLSKMACQDEYHTSLAYLFTLDEECNRHFNDLFDLKKDSIKARTALHHGWQTGTSAKTTRLAYNLWNGCTDDYDEDGNSKTSVHFAPDEIFCSGLTKYYVEALKLRFPYNFSREDV